MFTTRDPFISTIYKQYSIILNSKEIIGRVVELCPCPTKKNDVCVSSFHPCVGPLRVPWYRPWKQMRYCLQGGWWRGVARLPSCKLSRDDGIECNKRFPFLAPEL